MRRSDLIAKMALREKEIFEKYKDIYPFPAKEFAKEIGIKVIKKNVPAPMIEKKKGRYHLVVPLMKEGSKISRDLSERVAICIGLADYFFGFNAKPNDMNLLWATYAFLMSDEVIENAVLSGLRKKDLAEYFDVEVVFLKNYTNYLGWVRSMEQKPQI